MPGAVAKWKENERAARSRPVSPSLPLSGRETTVCVLFADGHTAEEIGVVLGLSPETIRAYLVRARLKYKNAGRRAADKLQLRACLVKDRYLSE